MLCLSKISFVCTHDINNHEFWWSQTIMIYSNETKSINATTLTIITSHYKVQHVAWLRAIRFSALKTPFRLAKDARFYFMEDIWRLFWAVYMNPSGRAGPTSLASFHLAFTSGISAILLRLGSLSKSTLNGFTASRLFIMMFKIILSLAYFQILTNRRLDIIVQGYIFGSKEIFVKLSFTQGFLLRPTITAFQLS